MSCVLCGRSGKLYRCARCRTVFYCSKEHQREDWRVHKVLCGTTNLEDKKEDAEVSDSSVRKVLGGNVSKASPTSLTSNGATEFSSLLVPANAMTPSQSLLSTTSEQRGTSSTPNLLFNSDKFGEADEANCSNFQATEEDPKELADTILPAEMGTVTLKTDCVLTKQQQQQKVIWHSADQEEPSFTRVTTPSFLHLSSRDSSVDEDISGRNFLDWMQQMCQFVVNDLEQYGICVIDNFAGRELAESARRSVVRMYESDLFVDGETVSPNLETMGNIRSDKIFWVDGSSSNSCAYITKLISNVDAVIGGSMRMKKDGQLGQRKISGRSKAMIACYPGNGTHYVKHVDNPNRDGRCITSTYYLNKDWDAKVNGGLLRIFPQNCATSVIDIEPILDRLVLFWSDRRNPHEVQPAYRTRFAITVWYFDSKEREEATRRKKLECDKVRQSTSPNE